MSVQEDAARLEALLPAAMTVLFRPDQEDPLRHHSVGQVRLLRALLQGNRAATDLSHTLGLSPSSLTQMAGRLIRAGLVAKELDSQDRRVRRLSLTAAGRNLMEGRQAMRARAAARLLQHIEPGRLQDLITFLEEIRSVGAEQSFALLEVGV